MTAATEQLNEMIDRLDAIQDAAAQREADAARSADAARPADAIDAILASEPRVTATRSLRDDPIVQRFREEYLTGLVQVDTMHQVIGLINRTLALVVV